MVPWKIMKTALPHFKKWRPDTGALCTVNLTKAVIVGMELPRWMIAYPLIQTQGLQPNSSADRWLPRTNMKRAGNHLSPMNGSQQTEPAYAKEALGSTNPSALLWWNRAVSISAWLLKPSAAEGRATTQQSKLYRSKCDLQKTAEFITTTGLPV